MWAELKKRIAQELETSEDEIEEPVKEGFGDFAYPCFKQAKEKHTDPKKVALQISQKVKIKNVQVKSVGPYVNFYVDWTALANNILKSIGPDYGKVRGKRCVVIDFSSPNPAHPFHMGTTRSTILGEALCRILQSQGWNVKRFCYINDLGRQAATLLLGYQLLAKDSKPEGKPDAWLGKLYFDINAKAAREPALQAKIDDIIKRLESGDAKLKKLAQKVFGWCLEGFKTNWSKLGIKFDDIVWESEFVRNSKKIVESAKKAGITFVSHGALLLRLEPELPNTVLLRKDGTGLYLTRDLACTLWKFNKYKPDLNVWIVAEEQSLHFKQIIKTLKLLGFQDFAKKCHHLAFGMVLLEGQKMSARKGWYVLWDELFEEGKRKAYDEISKRWSELNEKEKIRRAEQIALAAIVYFIVKYAPEKQVNFVWKHALNFEGDSGPYLQYTHARACSILTKAKLGKFDGKALTKPQEKKLLKLLSMYPYMLSKSALDLRPHYLAEYLHKLADSFNEFYQNVPVLRAEKEARAARLKLVDAVRTVLKQGMWLLGINAPEQM